MKAADNIRILSAAMVEKANSGHPGGSMGGADFVNVLYSKYLITDPDDPTWFCRDRLGSLCSLVFLRKQQSLSPNMQLKPDETVMI